MLEHFRKYFPPRDKRDEEKKYFVFDLNMDER